MIDVKLQPGWFARDVRLASAQEELLNLIWDKGGLTTAELRKVNTYARALIKARIQKAEVAPK